MTAPPHDGGPTAVAPAKQDTEPRVTELVEQGRRLLEEGDSRQALDRFRAAGKLAPGNEQAVAGEMASKARQLVESQDWERAAQMLGSDAALLANTVKWLLAERRSQDALALLRVVPDPARSSPLVAVEEGRLELARGEFERARLCFERAMAGDERALALEWQLVALRLLRLWPEFETLVAEALALDDMRAHAFAQRGWAHLVREEYGRAHADFDQALHEDEHHEFALRGKLLLLRTQNQLEQAEALLTKALDGHPENPGLVEEEALLLLARRRFTEAAARLERTRELARRCGRDDAYAHLRWGAALETCKRLDEAMANYESAARQDPDYAYPLQNIANLLWREGRYGEGSEAWSKALQVYELTARRAQRNRDADFFGHFGHLLLEIEHQPVEAEEALETGRRIDPDHVGILHKLVALHRSDAWGKGEAWKATEPYYRAVGVLEQALPGPDADPRAEDCGRYVWLGKLHREIGRLDQSERALKRAVECDPNSTVAWCELGVAQARRQRFRQAMRSFGEALVLDPDDMTVRSNAAEAALRVGMLDEAEVGYEDVLRTAPNHVESHLGLGEVHVAMADADEDQELYERAAADLTTALSLEGQKKASKTLTCSERAAALYLRGYAHMMAFETSGALREAGHLRKAKVDFREAKKLGNRKAERALAKLAPERPAAKRAASLLASVLVAALAICVFLLAQVVFWYGTVNFVFGKLVSEVDGATYVAISFGALLFLFAGLYGPHILKLKVGGIELEKTSVDQVAGPEQVGIAKTPRAVPVPHA